MINFFVLYSLNFFIIFILLGFGKVKISLKNINTIIGPPTMTFMYGRRNFKNRKNRKLHCILFGSQFFGFCFLIQHRFVLPLSLKIMSFTTCAIFVLKINVINCSCHLSNILSIIEETELEHTIPHNLSYYLVSQQCTVSQQRYYLLAFGAER